MSLCCFSKPSISLLDAVAAKDADALRKALQKKNKISESDRRSAVVNAAKTGSLEVLKILLDELDDLTQNIFDDALIEASNYKENEAIEIILQYQNNSPRAVCTIYKKACLSGSGNSQRILDLANDRIDDKTQIEGEISLRKSQESQGSLSSSRSTTPRRKT